MRDLGGALNALTRTRAIELQQSERRDAETADLLTAILLDAAAADRWLDRETPDVGEARAAIRKLIKRAKMLDTRQGIVIAEVIDPCASRTYAAIRILNSH